MFRDDDDDGVVESRAMIFSLRRSPAVVVVDCRVPASCAGSGSCFVSTNVELVVAFEVRPCAVFLHQFLLHHHHLFHVFVFEVRYESPIPGMMIPVARAHLMMMAAFAVAFC